MSDDKAQKRAQKRAMIAKEILETEQRYSEFLEVIVDVWFKPLEEAINSGNEIIPRSQLDGIFSNIALISEFHRQFVKDMEECAKEWTEAPAGGGLAPPMGMFSIVDASKSKQVATGRIPVGRMGALFKTFAPFLKMYTQYVRNHETASQMVTDLYNKKPKKFTQFSTTAVADPRNKGNTLFSLLIMPVQRVPRYKLLLSELIKNTEDTHRDYSDLLSAHSSIDKVAVHINEELRRGLNVARILALQSRFSGNIDLLKPGRVLLLDGPATKRGRRGEDPYYFVLFNDSLCYATTGMGGKLKMHRELPIDAQFAITILPENVDTTAAQVPVPADSDADAAAAAALSSPGGPGSPAGGRMTRQGVFPLQVLSSEKSFIILWNLECDRERWHQAFTQCIAESHNKAESRASASAAAATATTAEAVSAGYRPVQEEHTAGTLCKTCRSAVGVLDRFWCNLCGGICHSACCNDKLFVQWAGDARRVCGPCVEAARALASHRLSRLRASLGGSGAGSGSEIAPEAPAVPALPGSPGVAAADYESTSPSPAGPHSPPIPTRTSTAGAAAGGGGGASPPFSPSSPAGARPPLHPSRPPARSPFSPGSGTAAAAGPAPPSPALRAAAAGGPLGAITEGDETGEEDAAADYSVAGWLKWGGATAATFTQGLALGMVSVAGVAVGRCKSTRTSRLATGAPDPAATAGAGAGAGDAGAPTAAGRAPPPLPPRRRTAQGPTRSEKVEGWVSVGAGAFGLALGTVSNALSVTGKAVNASINFGAGGRKPAAAPAPAPATPAPAPAAAGVGAGAGAGAGVVGGSPFATAGRSPPPVPVPRAVPPVKAT